MKSQRSPLRYSKIELAFLKKNRAIGKQQLLERFLHKFGRNDVTIFNLRDILRRKGWQGPPKRVVPFSQTELRFFARHSHLRRRELHLLFVEKFNRPDVTPSNISNICWRHGLPSDSSLPKAIGTERLSRDGFVVLKVSESRGHNKNYAYKHRVLWERQNGAIPKGHRLKCLDGNRLNTDPSNWENVPNGVLGRLTKRDFENAPQQLKPTIMAVSRLEHITQSRVNFAHEESKQ